MSPWFGETVMDHGFGTNIFSVDTEEAGKVDQMFRNILTTHSHDEDLDPSAPALPTISELAHNVTDQVTAIPAPPPAFISQPERNSTSKPTH
jgi:hypothetical protein